MGMPSTSGSLDLGTPPGSTHDLPRELTKHGHFGPAPKGSNFGSWQPAGTPLELAEK